MKKRVKENRKGTDAHTEGKRFDREIAKGGEKRIIGDRGEGKVGCQGPPSEVGA